MLCSEATTDSTPCLAKNSPISFRIFGFSVTSVPTHLSMIASAFSSRMAPATIFVVVLSSGP